jgi:hypothetical protein
MELTGWIGQLTSTARGFSGVTGLTSSDIGHISTGVGFLSTRMTSSLVVQPMWEERIPANEWEIYRQVIRDVRSAGIPFAFGGAFATAVYTGQFRNTKDFDLYILPDDRQRVIELVHRSGLTDYFERLPYDRSWIYRASQGDVIVDAIWEMANHRAAVDHHWLGAGPEVSVRGERLRAIPVEELIWSKLYVLQRGRSDWVDVLNLIDAQATAIDWDHLVHRLAEDRPLLAAVLHVYLWLVPNGAGRIPDSIRRDLGLPESLVPADPELTRERAGLLDSRPWFRVHE